MPYKTRKVRNQDCYKVYNPINKRVFAKCTTREKANKQLRLLRAIQNNKNFRVTRGGKTYKNKKR
jgi:hypothetical protein